MRLPLFREAIISNIQQGSKKPAEVSVRIYKEMDDLIYVSKDKSRRSVIGYSDPHSGLFVTDTKDVELKNCHEPYKLFRDEATKYAQDAIDEKISELSALFDEDEEKYKTRYKNLALIISELETYITDKQAFYIDIQKQVDVLVSKPLPHVNEWLVYKDDELDGHTVVTERVPYNNPMKATLTDTQRTTVDDFLDVFLDDYNKMVLSWYFGAILSNIPISDDRISKALVVTSANGGSGKSTLINALANHVVTSPYRVIDSGFDKHFRANDKFSTSDLPTCRLGVYSEAYFNADTGENVTHNFAGLDESEMKSWIADGYVANEKKYADKEIAKLTGLQIILTNHPPEIASDRTDLRRRFLGVVVKPSNMVQDKSQQLGLRTEKALNRYIKKNAQAFANYFVHVFQSNPKQFQTALYNSVDVRNDITDSQSEYLNSKTIERTELTNHSALIVLSQLAKAIEVDSNAFIAFLTNERNAPSVPEVRWDNEYLYLSATKKFYVQHDVFPLREAIKEFVGESVKKYNQRMFKIARND